MFPLEPNATSFFHIVTHERPELVVDSVTGPCVAKEVAAKRISFVRGAKPMEAHLKKLPADLVAHIRPMFILNGAMCVAGPLALLVDGTGIDDNVPLNDDGV